MYVVHCADSAARTALLEQAATQLARASEGASVRLTCLNEEESDGLNIGAVQRALNTRWMGRVIIRATGEVSSTQDMLRGMPFRAPIVAGVVAVAKSQTSGRGRAGSIWEAPEGALAFSVEVRTRAQDLAFIQYGAALAVVEAAHTMGALSMRVKWPNDVVADGGKVAGVLCEASLCGGEAVVVVGVGINVGNERPGVSVSKIAGRKVEREGILACFLDAFERFCDTLQKDGFHGVLKQRYIDMWLHSAQRVTLEDENVTATIVGLAPDGAVRVRRDDASIRDLPPDVTSLDLEKGVLRVKIQRGLASQ